VDNPDSDAGFAAAFDRYAPAVLRYAQRRLGSQDLAWDVVTETFTAAWRHWDRRPAPADLLPWLYAIAANAVRGQLRSSQRRRRLVTRPTPAAAHQRGLRRAGPGRDRAAHAGALGRLSRRRPRPRRSARAGPA
jgi:DNA-directed RNA polymerase specialized sigma24 family protein